MEDISGDQWEHFAVVSKNGPLILDFSIQQHSPARSQIASQGPNGWVGVCVCDFEVWRQPQRPWLGNSGDTRPINSKAAFNLQTPLFLNWHSSRLILFWHLLNFTKIKMLLPAWSSHPRYRCPDLSLPRSSLKVAGHCVYIREPTGAPNGKPVGSSHLCPLPMA